MNTVALIDVYIVDLDKIFKKLQEFGSTLNLMIGTTYGKQNPEYQKLFVETTLTASQLFNKLEKTNLKFAGIVEIDSIDYSGDSNRNMFNDFLLETGK